MQYVPASNVDDIAMLAHHNKAPGQWIITIQGTIADRFIWGNVKSWRAARKAMRSLVTADPTIDPITYWCDGTLFWAIEE